MKYASLSDAEILKIIKPLAEHTEGSWNRKDYDEFCKYLLTESPDKRLPEEEFNRQIEESYDTYGIHMISELVAIHRNPDNVIVIWKVNFEKREEPGLLIYGFKEHQGRILIEGCSYHA